MLGHLETNMRTTFLRGCRLIVLILFRNVCGLDMVEPKVMHLQTLNH